MKQFLLRRAVQSAVLIVLVIVVCFFIFRLMPGDPTMALIDPNMPFGMREQLAERFGLDDPLGVQFVRYLREAFKLNLGVSFYYNSVSVSRIILGPKLLNTAVLMVLSLTLSLVLGTALGLIAGWKENSALDYALTNVGLVSYSMPVFWSGLLILLALGYHWNLIPLGGTVSYGVEMSVLQRIGDRALHLAGPTVTLCLLFVGQFLIVMRNTVAEIFRQDYMRTARAKGLRKRTIVIRYAMRNALLPTVSLTAALSPLLIGGATMTEVVFSYDGIGRLIYDSVLRRDYPVLQGVFIVMAVVVIVANLVADVAYAYLDPRITYR